MPNVAMDSATLTIQNENYNFGIYFSVIIKHRLRGISVARISRIPAKQLMSAARLAMKDDYGQRYQGLLLLDDGTIIQEV